MRRCFAFVILVFTVACGGGSTGPANPMSPTPTLVSLTGFVSAQPGGRIGGAAVRIVDGPNVGKSTTTTAGGDFRFEGLTQGSGNVVASASGYLDETQSVFINGTNTVAFTLPTAQPWSMSGQGNTVFDMPTYIRRVRITGRWTGNGVSNFIVFISRQLVVNEILRQTGDYSGVHATTGGVVETQSSNNIIWTFTEERTGSPNPPPPGPTPPPPTPPPSTFSCTAMSTTAQVPAPLVTFSEPEVMATWTETYSEGSYAACPLRNSRELTQLTVNGISLSGRFTLRNLWQGCTSPNPTVVDGGVLQATDNHVSFAIPSASRPTTLRMSLAVDGGNPDPRFDLVVTDATGATASTTFTTSVGKVVLSCTNPIASVGITHSGRGWVLDSIAF